MTKYVKTDYDGCEYITAGKWYEVIRNTVDGGYIVDDDGDEFDIVFEQSKTIGYNAWTVSDTKPLTIEAGKYYRTRDGRKVGPMVRWSAYATYMPFETNQGTPDFDISKGLWTNDGKCDEGNQADLIAEWQDEAPTTGTLWRDMTPEEKGALLLAKHEGRRIEVWSRTEWVGLHYAARLEDYHAYRIAPPEPVVETVEMYTSKKMKGFGLIRGPKSTHRITFKTVDGVPDCGSVKMEAV